MGEADKPFACPLSECGMKFTNEDHLTVHKKKHDMCLNISNGQKMNVFVADQTPTPTRFIRNCEEVGLFQDLQNVNPFEEQFRKAAEAAKSGSTPLHEAEPMCGPVDDALHTPQVFSQLEHARHPPVHVRGPSPEPQLETPSCSSVETHHKDILQQPVALLLRLPGGKLVKLSAMEMAENEQEPSSASVISMPSVMIDETRTPGSTQGSTPASTPSSSASDASGRLALAKQRLKQTISANRRKLPVDQQANIMPRQRPQPSHVVPSLMLNNVAMPVSAAKRNREKSASSGDDTDIKRQKFLERNRAAASRCRQKRKHWVNTLQRRSDLIHATNQQLVAEVGNLRSEVAQLKSLLLAHRDCPVTKAMCQAGVLQLVETGSGSVRAPSVINLAPAKQTHNVMLMQPTPSSSAGKPLLISSSDSETVKPRADPGSDPQVRRSGVLKFVHQINKETVIIQNVTDK